MASIPKTMANVDESLHQSTLTKPVATKLQTKRYRNLDDFLRLHQIQKDGTSQNITNTRITNEELRISGGSFNIPQEDYATFLDLYVQHRFVKGHIDHLTEKQLEKGPILCDLDFRFDVNVTHRLYTNDDVFMIVDGYLENLKKIYQFDDTTAFPVFVFQKPDVNVVPSKNITKDGIHIIIGIQANRQVQLYLRKRMIEYMPQICELPIINTWEDVFDLSISSGSAGWQLYGSCKPGFGIYELTHHITVGYDSSDGEFQMTTEDVSKFNIKRDIALLSARYANHYDPFLKSEIIAEIAKEVGDTSSKRKTVAYSDKLDIMQVTNHDELAAVFGKFMDSISGIDDHLLREVTAYTMILPEQYYGEGSYSNWIKVGWALHNTNYKLFVVWVMFSAQSSTFDFTSIPEMLERWNKSENNGLSYKSIIRWAKQDAAEKFYKVKEETLNYYIEQTLNPSIGSNASDKDKKPAGSSDFDLATVLYHMLKDNFVCVSVKSNIWYEYVKHRWQPCDSGTTLRLAISTTMRKLYMKKAEQIFEDMHNLTNKQMTEDERTKIETLLKRKYQRAEMIVSRLASTNDKKNIMTEAKELFYDSNFIKQTDTRPYLLCFNNGVWDFNEKVFRDGRPEDYLTMSTKIDYVPIDPIRDATALAEIADFMKKLFPVPDLERYMWEHLASVLIGNSANQTFHNYIGVGENGKSVLVTLLEKCLGDYKGDVPTSLLTEKRAKVGGLTPELVQLKGVRYAVMNEPSKGERINEGIMKQMTSALDPIQCRAPYMIEALSYIPQFKLIVLANNLMEIKSQDHGTWRRIRVVDFLSLFTDTPVEGDPEKPYQYKKDSSIPEKFDAWKTVFMSLLVNKALETGGKVGPCAMVTASSEEYRRKQDVISEFIGERVIRMENRILKKAVLSFEFSSWHTNTYGVKGPNAKEVHSYLDRMFSKSDSTGWRGICIKSEFLTGNAGHSDDDNDNDDLENEIEDPESL